MKSEKGKKKEPEGLAAAGLGGAQLQSARKRCLRSFCGDSARGDCRRRKRFRRISYSLDKTLTHMCVVKPVTEGKNHQSDQGKGLKIIREIQAVPCMCEGGDSRTEAGAVTGSEAGVVTGSRRLGQR